MSGSIIIDMSQAALNRTAMYQISMDTYEELARWRKGCQFFGSVFADIPSALLLKQLRDERLPAVLADPEGYLESLMSSRVPTSIGTTTLYLDPLYVLFGGLTGNDFVTVLDLSTVAIPKWHPPQVARAYEVALDYIQSTGTKVLAISQNTADSLYANYGIPPERVTVLPLYVPGHLVADLDAVRPLYCPSPYVLFVGSLELRKNVLGAIRSFALSGLAARGYQLLIAGGGGHGEERIRAAARQARNVVLCGYVSNEELRSLYAGARAFLYPSYWEGFGVPLLEALSYGVPSVASSTGACPEVGGSLVQYCDPDDHLGFADALLQLIAMTENDRKIYKERSRQWVTERFSYQQFSSTLRRALGLPLEDARRGITLSHSPQGQGFDRTRTFYSFLAHLRAELRHIRVQPEFNFRSQILRKGVHEIDPSMMRVPSGISSEYIQLASVLNRNRTILEWGNNLGSGLVNLVSSALQEEIARTIVNEHRLLRHVLGHDDSDYKT